VSTVRDAVVVPDDAVKHGTDGLYAYAVKQDDKAELRKIKVGASIDGETVIENGLIPGERVIIAGQYRVQPGSAVTTTVADSEPSDGKAH
jgi:multidrug efflux system membrane fusion protein